MIVTSCYFLKSIKSGKGKKNRFVCALWLSVHMKSVVEQEFFHEFTLDNKALKAFVEFRIC